LDSAAGTEAEALPTALEGDVGARLTPAAIAKTEAEIKHYDGYFRR
jgi:hypothetical protein